MATPCVHKVSQRNSLNLLTFSIDVNANPWGNCVCSYGWTGGRCDIPTGETYPPAPGSTPEPAPGPTPAPGTCGYCGAYGHCMEWIPSTEGGGCRECACLKNATDACCENDP